MTEFAISQRSLLTRALPFGIVIFLSGCSPATRVVDDQGGVVADVRRGFCFVGCNIKSRFPGGETCSGYATGMEYGQPLYAAIYCKDVPAATLQVDEVKRSGPSTGKLTPNANPFAQEAIDVDAIVARHVPNPET